MKIVNIFAHRLFSFHYNSEEENEYDRMIKLWNDTEHIYEFLKANQRDVPKTKDIKQMAVDILDDAIELDEKLIEITSSSDKKLKHFFQALNNQEYQAKILSLQKGRESFLRMYAIKIDDDTYIITGGAIKLPLQHLMEDRKHTQIELEKLKFAKDYLKSKQVFDEESFFEFLNEECHDE